MTVEAKTERHALWEVLDGLQMDARALTAKIVALRAVVAQLDLPEPSHTDCPRCGMRTKGRRSLAEHMYQIHGGSLPEHWEGEA